jgi:hypothetical protein
MFLISRQQVVRIIGEHSNSNDDEIISVILDLLI